jgi:hypothetical protein
MDFGLDKLVEMIEERFGRLAGTVVLAAIGVAALAFAVHAVFSFLLVPAVRYAPTVLGSVGIALGRMSIADAIYAGIETLIGMLAGLVFFGVSRLMYIRFHKRALATTEEILRETKDTIENCKAFTDRNHAKLDAHADTLMKACDQLVEDALLQANALLAEAAARAGEPPPAPLTIGGIGSRVAREKELAKAASEKMKLIAD